MVGKSTPAIIFGLVAITTALFLAWVNNSQVPESIPEQWKVKAIDASMRLYQLVIGTACFLGWTHPLSPFDRSLAAGGILFQVTGSPWWTYSKNDLKVTDRRLAGVRVKMYEPVSTLDDVTRPVVVYMHGGGWITLSPDAYEPLTSKIALDADVVVISIDYRLSPQVPFPGPRSDCVAVLKHILTHGKEMGLDTNRIALAGDSAGGNLAASLALEFKNKIALQIIMVPALQPIDSFTPSAIENAPYMSSSINNRLMYSAYLLYGGLPIVHLQTLINNTHVPRSVRDNLYKHKLNMDDLIPSEVIRTQELRVKKATHFGENPDTNTVWKVLEPVFTDPYFAPLLADDESLHQTSRCYVMTAGYDLIRDDGVMYYHRLMKAGVVGVWKHYPESFHHALMFHSGPYKLEVGERIVNDLVEYIKKTL